MKYIPQYEDMRRTADEFDGSAERSPKDGKMVGHQIAEELRENLPKRL